MAKSRIVSMVTEELGRISKYTKGFLFNSKEARYLWDRSDDAIRTTKMLSDIYPNIPKKLDTIVHVLEFHKLVCSSKSEKKAILKWLNRK